MNQEIFTTKDIEVFAIKFRDKISNDGTLEECDKSYIRALFSECLIDMNNDKMRELMTK